MFVQDGIEVAQDATRLRLRRSGWSQWLLPGFFVAIAVIPAIWMLSDESPNIATVALWVAAALGMAAWTLYDRVEFVEADTDGVALGRRIGPSRRYAWRDIREVVVEQRRTRDAKTNQTTTDYWAVLDFYTGARVPIKMGGSEDQAHLIRRMIDEFGQRRGGLAHPQDFSEWLEGHDQAPR